MCLDGTQGGRVVYRVVIIDDEPIIVRGLTQLIPWEKYGCEVAGTAGDGQEGLELIRSLRPHMVFTDIYMPKMDGLGMAAALKSEFEDMELTVLTGYRDFSLAQQAIRLGVARFLLKPSNMEELEEAVEAMAAHLRKKGITGEEEAQLDEDETGAALSSAEFTDAEGAVTESTGKESGRKEGAGRESAGKEGAGTEATGTESAAGSFIVNRALEYMQENFRQKVTLTDVAEHTYVSQWHLSKLLNRHTGKSFSELLNTIRIDEAKQLLADPSLRIGDVAEIVGFLDMAHFSRVFKKLTGVSANEYRNRM